MTIADREYWTAKQCADVLGRSRDFWLARMKAGDVSGYLDNTRRYINAASARKYLAAITVQPERTLPG